MAVSTKNTLRHCKSGTSSSVTHTEEKKQKDDVGSRDISKQR